MERSKINTNPAEGIGRAMLSDAGAWLARLNGPLRDEATEDGFQRWLGEDSRHAQAFRLLTEDWERAGELKRFAHIAIGAGELARPPHYGTEAPRENRRNREMWSEMQHWVAIAASVLVAATAGGTIYFKYFAGVTTGVGEQRTLALEDGSRILLNTDTRIVEHYSSRERWIELKNGEALFDVAPQPARPFIVTAGGRTITALGTSFNVRSDPAEFSVTLIDGKVAVAPSSESIPTVLTPGQRFIVGLKQKTHATGSATVDRPQIEKITAWQQGKVVIDNMTLADAIAEMNRYSKVRIEIEKSQVAALPLSGVFAAGQSEAFARAVAESYSLQVIDERDTIVLR